MIRNLTYKIPAPALLGAVACALLTIPMACAVDTTQDAKGNQPVDAAASPEPQAATDASTLETAEESTWHAPPAEGVTGLEKDATYLRALHALAVGKASTVGSWDATAEIVGRYPVYLPGIEEPSYYEYKVARGQSDAGYVLVNANQTDIAVAESATEGPTLTERYRDLMGNTAFKVYRYGPVTSAAKVAEADGGERIVAVSGVLTGAPVVRLDASDVSSAARQQIIDADGRYRDAVAARGCVPGATRETLDAHYRRLGAPPDPSLAGSSLGYAQSDIDVSSYELAHGFFSTSKLPKWWQPHNSSDYPVGCGPVAWAMVLAYWSKFGGTPGFFDFEDISDYAGSSQFENTFVEDIMWEIAGDLGTVYGGSSDKWGMTYPSDMPKIVSYVKRAGYLETSASKEDVGAHDKWNKAKSAITHDNPPVLFIHDDGIGVANHYVVAQAVRKEDTGIDSLGYYANFGNGGDPKWIYDLDGEPDYTVSDVIVLDKARNPVSYADWYPATIL